MKVERKTYDQLLLILGRFDSVTKRRAVALLAGMIADDIGDKQTATMLRRIADQLCYDHLAARTHH